MAMAVVLIDDNVELILTAAATAELARMGVTDVTFVSGDSTIGVVIEGWAFDPSTATEAVTVLRGREAPARTLHPIAHTVISAVSIEGEET